MSVDSVIAQRLAEHSVDRISSLSSAGQQRTLERTNVAAATAQPYVVFIVNTTGVNLFATVYFAALPNTGVIQTVDEPVPNGAQTGIQLGGPAACSTIVAYRLILDDGAETVGDTGAIAAHQNAASPCVDAWAIQA